MVRMGWVSMLVLSLVAMGCTNYYIVKDPATGNTYFTKDLDERVSGAVVLEDEKSGARVTLQNSEIREVKKDEYKAALTAPPPVPPPAPAAPPQVIIQNVPAAPAIPATPAAPAAPAMPAAPAAPAAPAP